MSRSPLEMLIDSAVSCVKCGTKGVGNCACWDEPEPKPVTNGDLELQRALAEKRSTKAMDREEKRKAVLRLRRLDPDLNYAQLGRRVGVGRDQARTWCIDAGLPKERGA